MDKWTIREAGEYDAAALSELAKMIYRQYYLHLWYDHGEWYQEAMYRFEKTREELGDDNNIFYLVYEDQRPVAYLKLRRSARLAGYDPEECLELERIYIRKESSGQGLGSILVEQTLSLARSLGKKMVFLKAMDSSLDAIRFYENKGFSVCGTLTLPFPEMKVEYRGMVIMKNSILPG